MAHTATLTANLTWDWQDWRGRERSEDVELEYTCDADFHIELKSISYGGAEMDDPDLDALLDYVAGEYAPDAYAEWLADRDDYRCEDNTVPPQVAA